jgi:hypothetical protein
MAEKAYTARQLAERYGVAASTVRGWLLRRLLPGAYLQKTELGDSYWLVPESALKDFLPPKPGPIPRASGTDGKVTVKPDKKTAKK